MYSGGRPGGSVAERVLMFEKSPSAFGVEPVQVRVPQRREPQLSGTVITPWKPSLETASSRAQAQHQTFPNERIVPINRVESSPQSPAPAIKVPEVGAGLSLSCQPPTSSSTSSSPLLSSLSSAPAASPAPAPAPAASVSPVPSRWEPPVVQTFPRRTTQPA